MNKIYENIRIEPMININNTAAATSPRKVLWNDDKSMLFYFKFGGASPTGTAISCTEVKMCQMTLYEATASSHAGSAITGATFTIGCQTAYEPRSAESLILTMTSLVTTAHTLHINGYEYKVLVSGVGSSGENVATQIAGAINGQGTHTKLPHYSAKANFTDTGIVLVYPDDGQGTGLTIATAAATFFKTRVPAFTGCIELKAESLSTNTPKWIGVSLSVSSGASAARSVDCIRFPNYAPAFGGVTTYV